MGRARRRTANGHGRGRKRSGGTSCLVLGLIFVALLGWTLYAVKAGESARAGGQQVHGSAPGTQSPAAPPTTVTPTRTATVAPARTTTAAPAVPEHGNGEFSTADASGQAVGRGRIRRYKVQVEAGAGISSTDAAKEIQGILADPRGWTDDKHDGFQLVSSGAADFVIKIATPDTVDRICGAAGLHTHGEVNCDVGPTVVVNLKRWLLGSPQFPGPIHGYRALIINHEVGHRIGHGHEGCPGSGKLAPVMMQQIDGLHGCKANAWPYTADGQYIQGPPVT